MRAPFVRPPDTLPSASTAAATVLSIFVMPSVSTSIRALRTAGSQVGCAAAVAAAAADFANASGGNNISSSSIEFGGARVNGTNESFSDDDGNATLQIAAPAPLGFDSNILGLELGGDAALGTYVGAIYSAFVLDAATLALGLLFAVARALFQGIPLWPTALRKTKTPGSVFLAAFIVSGPCMYSAVVLLTHPRAARAGLRLYGWVGVGVAAFPLVALLLLARHFSRYEVLMEITQEEAKRKKKESEKQQKAAAASEARRQQRAASQSGSSDNDNDSSNAAPLLAPGGANTDSDNGSDGNGSDAGSAVDASVAPAAPAAPATATTTTTATTAAAAPVTASGATASTFFALDRLRNLDKELAAAVDQGYVKFVLRVVDYMTQPVREYAQTNASDMWKFAVEAHISCSAAALDFFLTSLAISFTSALSVTCASRDCCRYTSWATAVLAAFHLFFLLYYRVFLVRFDRVNIPILSGLTLTMAILGIIAAEKADSGGPNQDVIDQISQVVFVLGMISLSLATLANAIPSVVFICSKCSDTLAAVQAVKDGEREEQKRKGAAAIAAAATASASTSTSPPDAAAAASGPDANNNDVDDDGGSSDRSQPHDGGGSDGGGREMEIRRGAFHLSDSDLDNDNDGDGDGQEMVERTNNVAARAATASPPQQREQQQQQHASRPAAALQAPPPVVEPRSASSVRRGGVTDWDAAFPDLALLPLGSKCSNATGAASTFTLQQQQPESRHVRGAAAAAASPPARAPGAPPTVRPRFVPRIEPGASFSVEYLLRQCDDSRMSPMSPYYFANQRLRFEEEQRRLRALQQAQAQAQQQQAPSSSSSSSPPPPPPRPAAANLQQFAAVMTGGGADARSQSRPAHSSGAGRGHAAASFALPAVATQQEVDTILYSPPRRRPPQPQPQPRQQQQQRQQQSPSNRSGSAAPPASRRPNSSPRR
jgi:hypothetical protein